MKNRYFSPLLAALLLAAPFFAQAQTGSVGIGTTAPDASAALDIVSTGKGALLPRLPEAARLAMGTGAVPAPAAGLLLYQTDGAKPGFWYNQGTGAAPAWLRLTDGGAVSYDPATGLQVGPGPVAGGINVPAGATGVNGPFRSNAPSARTETLYPAAYLTALGLRAGPLTAIAYRVNTKNSTQPYANFTLALGQTTAPTLGTAYTASGLTTVFTGAVTMPAAGQVLTLAFNGSPFAWDGSSAVLVQTCFQNATASPANDVVDGQTVTSSRIFAAGTTSQCAAPTGFSSASRPNAGFAQPGAYVLPPFAGQPGQVLTQQAGGAVAFQSPALSLSGQSLGIAGGNTVTLPAPPDGTDFIQNQTAASQPGGFRLGGTGTVGSLGVGTGAAAPRGQLDVRGGDTYLVTDPDNGSAQNVFLPGHLYLAPYSGTSGTAYLQARVPNPTAATDIGLTLRTTDAGALTDALTLAPNGDVQAAGTLQSTALAGTGTRPLTATAGGTLAPAGAGTMLARLAAAQSGTYTVGSSASAGQRNLVGFPVAFASPPSQVLLTVRGENGLSVNDTFATTVYQVSATRFFFNVWRVDSGAGSWGQNLRVDWLVIP